MAIKDLDFLSEKINIFFYGRSRHVSIIGGILTLIMVALCITYISYLLMDIYKHKSSNYVSYTKFQKNIDEFSFNNTGGLFHFLQFMDVNDNIIGQYNSKYVRIFMTNLNHPHLKNIERLENIEHWIYDKCRKGIDDKNISQDLSIDNDINFSKGACLRYYYNNIDKNYYPIEDKLNFKYPYLNPKIKNNTESIFLNTIIEKCSNNSISTKILGNCANENEIDEYLNNYRGIYLNLLEYQVNTDNYSEPIIQKINHIYTEMSDFDASEIQINNIDLSPFHIKIQKGLFIPKSKKINTYIFNSNIQSNLHKLSNKNIISIFNYKIVNLSNVFQGGYNTLYDVLPSVGGIIQLIYYILFCFNYFIDKFTTIQDSENLFFKFNDSNEKKAEEKKMKYKQTVMSARQSLKNSRTKEFLSLKLFQQNLSNNNIQNDINGFNAVNSFKKSLNEIQERNEMSELDLSNEQKSKISFVPSTSNNNLSIKINQEEDISDFNGKITINSNKNPAYNKKEDLIQKLSLFKKATESKSRNSLNSVNSINNKRFSKQFCKFLYNKKNNIKLEILSESYLKKYTSFFYYFITFMGQISRRSKPFYIIDSFREKLLSEEHFFRSHVYLYCLEKYFGVVESGKIDITELYNYL